MRGIVSIVLSAISPKMAIIGFFFFSRKFFLIFTGKNQRKKNKTHRYEVFKKLFR